MGEASPEAGGSPAGLGPPIKGKSCKGCLYYSSVLKSRGYNPICVGIPRSIPQVPSYVVDEPKEEAASQGHDLRKFRYGCAGYSMFVENRDGQGGEGDGKTLLPYCRGIELLVERKPSTAEQAPAYVSKDASSRSHQQGQQRPADLARQEFLGRKVTVPVPLVQEECRTGRFRRCQEFKQNRQLYQGICRGHSLS
ncbi:hypothetical protein QOZ80_6BG0482540 [Eleusine coracana subsp. coracana]|nr:hypothetical protein QOZ80_6BG0482540 [Eleusine coracana subsp. coracana]